MSSPRRLLEEASDSFELRILRAAASDRGSEQALARTLTALAAVPRVTAASAGGVRLLTALKGVAVGAAVGFTGLVLAGSWPTESPRALQGKAVEGTARLPTSRPSSLVPDPQQAVGGVASSGSVAPPPLRTEPARGSARALAQSASAKRGAGAGAELLPGAKRIQPGKGSQLAREIALLDRARAELAAGRSSEALATLELREREIDSPLLTPEATLIRIEALVRRGDITPARAVAERFLAQNPSSAQAERVRRLLANQRP